MTNDDFDRFVIEFSRLAAALVGFKQSPQEAKAKADAYFHVLKKYALSDVIAKADYWLEHESKMPKPAEWAGVIVPKAAPPLQRLSDEASAVWKDAEAQGCEGPPCHCPACREAGVDEKSVRFVPDFLFDDREKKVRLGEKIITAGHWAHGFELFRWYEARANFWNAMVERYGPLGPAPKRKKQPFGERLKALLEIAVKTIPTGQGDEEKEPEPVR